jgi:hypothetical protein
MPSEPDDLPTRAELARDLLLHVMRDYAEESCASWLVDQEFHLWEASFLGRFPHATDEAGARVDFCKRLDDLGTLAGGWWAWPSSVGRTGHQEVFFRWMSSIRSMRRGSINKKATV